MLNGIIDERGKYIYLTQTEVDVRILLINNIFDLYINQSSFLFLGCHELYKKQRKSK